MKEARGLGNLLEMAKSHTSAQAPVSGPPSSLVDYDMMSEARRVEDAIRVARFPPRHVTQKERHGTEWTDARSNVTDLMLSRRGSGSIVVLTGSRGTGKTQMAIDIAITMIRVKVASNVRYYKAMELFMAIKAGYSADVPEDKVLRDFISPDLLILDEIQEKADTEWHQRLFTYLIDVRYDKMKSTILIGNISAPQKGVDPLLACIGDSAYSRIVETGTIVEAKWETYRK